MSDEFEEFARQIGNKNHEGDKDIYKRKQFKCPDCSEVLTEAYIEQNPFPEIPCPSCGTLIANTALKETEVPASNEREDIRCEANLKVTYKSIDAFITEYTRNVCKGGMFIHTGTHHRKGTKIELLLEVPGLNAPLKINSEVVHTKFLNVSDEDRGVGVKFLDMDEKSRDIIVNYIKTLRNCL